MTDRHNRKQTMTLEDAAKRLEMGPLALRQLIKDGKGPGVVSGTHYHIRISWIEKFEKGEPFYTVPNPSLDAQPIKKQPRVSPFRIVERKAS